MKNKKNAVIVNTVVFITENCEGEVKDLRSYSFATVDEAKIAAKNFPIVNMIEEIFISIHSRIQMLHSKGKEICHYGVYFGEFKEYDLYSISPLVCDDEEKERINFYSHYNKQEFKQELLFDNNILVKMLEFMKFYQKFVDRVFHEQY